jgi:hypothetical protein
MPDLPDAGSGSLRKPIPLLWQSKPIREGRPPIFTKDALRRPAGLLWAERRSQRGAQDLVYRMLATAVVEHYCEAYPKSGNSCGLVPAEVAPRAADQARSHVARTSDEYNLRGGSKRRPSLGCNRASSRRPGSTSFARICAERRRHCRCQQRGRPPEAKTPAHLRTAPPAWRGAGLRSRERTAPRSVLHQRFGRRRSKVVLPESTPPSRASRRRDATCAGGLQAQVRFPSAAWK